MCNWVCDHCAGEDPLVDDQTDQDINSVAGVLKLYFRGLENPLFPKERFLDFISTTSELIFILAFVHSILLQRIKNKQIDDLDDVPNCLDNISYCRHFCQDRRSQQEKVRFHPRQRDECFWAVWLTESVTRSLLESVRAQKLHPLPVLCDSYRCTMETREWTNRTQLFSKGKHFFFLSLAFSSEWSVHFVSWGRAEWLVRFQLSIIAREGSKELKQETRAVAFSTELMQPLAWHSHLSAVRIAVAQ